MIHSYFKSCTKSFSSRLVFLFGPQRSSSFNIESASSQNCTIIGFLQIYESIPTCSGPLKFSLCYLSKLCLNLLELTDFSLSGDFKYSRKLSSISCHFISADFWWWVIIRRLKWRVLYIPTSAYAWVLIIPLDSYDSKLCFDNKGILCVKELGEKYGKYWIQVAVYVPSCSGAAECSNKYW